MASTAVMVGMLQALLWPLFWSSEVLAIDCYSCHSFNNSDIRCGDPFHPAYGKYVERCTQGKDGHVGEFPAKYCIKLIGKTVKSEVEMVFRGCSLESLDSQCGQFKYEDVRYSGCVMSCEEDGCNRTSGFKPDVVMATVICLIALFLVTCFNQIGN